MSLLHINSSSASAVQAYIQNTNGATNSSAELVFGVWSGAIPTGSGNPGPSAKIVALNTNATNAATDLIFHTYSAAGSSPERMRITSTGQIQYANNGNQTNLLTYSSNQDKGITNFYQAQNYPSSNNYTRVLDIISSGDATGGGAIRFLTSVANTAPATSMLITSGGSIIIGATSVPSGATEFVTGSLFVNSNLYIGNSSGTSGQTFRFDGFQNALYGLWSNASGVDQTGVVLNYGAGSWTSTSDEKLKDINSNIENAVDKLMTLRAINFSWKIDETKKENLGLIAQDVEKVFPQVVDVIKDGNLGVRYTDLIPVLVKAIQEQQKQIEELKQLVK